MEYNKKEYTGKGQGNFNTVGAAAGIASLLGVDLGGIGGVLNSGDDCHGHDHGHDHVHFVTEKENDLGIALAISRSEANTGDKMMENLKELYAETLRLNEAQRVTDEKISQGVITNLQSTAELKADVKCMQREIERNREEGYRNLAEAKDYTNVRVDALAKQTGCEVEKVYLWTQAQNYVPGTIKVDPNQICGVSPIATPVGCGCNLG